MDAVTLVSTGDVWLTPGWRLKMPMRHRMHEAGRGTTSEGEPVQQGPLYANELQTPPSMQTSPQTFPLSSKPFVLCWLGSPLGSGSFEKSEAMASAVSVCLCSVLSRVGDGVAKT